MTVVPAPRPLGPGGPLVPPLALGSWNTWDRMPADDAAAMIRSASHHGAGFFDVAHYDTGPHAEGSSTDVLFGEAFRASGVDRTEVMVCGKLWLWDWPAQPFRRQIEQSLERIGIDRFDAVVVGDYAATPDLARVVDEVDELVRDGLVGAWGINNWLIGDTLEVLDLAERKSAAPPVFAQLKYSIARRAMAEGPEYGDLFDRGVLALQASDVFEGGVLLGTASPGRRIGADVGGIRSRILAAAPEVAEIAAEHDATPAQVAIAFCLALPATANVLFGASRPAQLEMNLRAIDLAARHGEAIRPRLDHLRQDDDVPSDGRWPAASA